MLDFLYTAVSWVLLRWYQLFTFLGLGKDSGLTWALSIIMLVATARLVLFRFFVKQVHYQRRMQEMQPKIKKLQEKHKGDKATLQREMMAMQQAEGFNPISGCLPMFLQIPIFISLFHVLKHMSNSVGSAPGSRGLTLYGFTEAQTTAAAHAKLFNAPLAASLRESADKITQLGGHVTTTRTVSLILVLISAAATYITQRAVMKNQSTPPEGQAAMIQRLMQVGIPISVIFSGFIFPLGVLLYWFTSNLWTMGQQFYIFRFHPHIPGGTAAVAAGPVGEVGRALAPKVGQKPVSAKGTRAGVTPPAGGATPAKSSAAAKMGASAKTGIATKTDTATKTVVKADTGAKGATAMRVPDDASSAGSDPAANRQPAKPPRSNGNRPTSNKRSPGKKRR